MKFSYTWLRELVDGLDTPPQELERLITVKTAECEGVEEAGALLANASEALRPLRRADRLRAQSESRLSKLAL